MAGNPEVRFYCWYFSTCSHEWYLVLLSRKKETVFQWHIVERDNKICAVAPLYNSLKGCQRLQESSYLSFHQRVLKGLPACVLTNEGEGKMQIKCAAGLTHFGIVLLKLVAKRIQQLPRVNLSLHLAAQSLLQGFLLVLKSSQAHFHWAAGIKIVVS